MYIINRITVYNLENVQEEKFEEAIMTGNTLGWVIVAFVLYLLMMIAIGAFYAKGNNNSEDYFLGGRKLNGFVAALSRRRRI